MVGLPIPLTAIRRRRNPINRRVVSLAINQAEDILLQLQVYEQEGDPAPIDLRNARLYFVLERWPHYLHEDWGCGPDYGFAAWSLCGPRLIWTINATGAGTLQTPAVANSPTAPLDRVDLLIPAVVNQFWHGRYAFAIQADLELATCTLIHGVMQVHRCLSQSLLLPEGGPAGSLYDIANFDQGTYAPEVIAPSGAFNPDLTSGNTFDGAAFDKGTFGP